MYLYDDANKKTAAPWGGFFLPSFADSEKSMTFLVFSFSLFIVPLLAESAMSWRAIKTAQKRFPTLWRHSGSPTLMGNGDLMKSWPLVKYYRDRGYLRVAEYGEAEFPPITVPEEIDFAEKLRLPLLWTYWAAWAGAGAFLVVFIGGGIYFY